MAQIKNIVRDNPLSNFRQVAPDGGSTFRLLAEAMSTAYDRVAPVAIAQMENEGAQFGRGQARKQFGERNYRVSTRSAPQDTLGLIREFEGFRETPYWDVNAHRAGYGSDTVTNPDGSIRRVKLGDRVSREDAERDLSRRVNEEFIPIARRAIGERFDNLNEQQRAALTSIAYNYGEIPDRIVGAIRNGTAAEGAAAIRSLAGDNEGINSKRRNREADLFESGGEVMRVSTRNEPGAMVRTSDGKLEARRFSPYAGPILQAHDAAAKVAYQAEVMNNGTIDLMDLSNQYLLDPDGFNEAAESYIDSIVDQAPEEMRADLYDVLGTEAKRRQLGIMEDKQRDIRQRADNSSRALVERWTDTYAEALVSGDPNEIAAAQRRLDSVLQAREALPGVAWTEEQSANVFIKAEQLSARMEADQRKARGQEYKDTFSLITKARKAGRVAEGEDILQNPEAIEMFPEEAREAAAYVELGNQMPELMAMTPAQQAAVAAQLSASEVSEEWELDVVDAVASIAKENRKAWQDDPVKRAGEVLASSEMGPPPALPDLIPAEQGKFVTALMDRREYMTGVFEAGYTDTMAYLSDEEAKRIAMLMSKDTEPEVRAAMASAIVAGFGPEAMRVFSEINADPVTMFAGKMMAVGGRPDVAADMIRGQTMIDEGLVQIPPKSDRVGSVDSQLGTAFDGIPGSEAIQKELMLAAQAIYATMARGVDPSSEDAKAKMKLAVQKALGQETNKRGQLTGGIQTVFDDDTILPVGVNGKEAEARLRMALGADPEESWLRFDPITGPIAAIARAVTPEGEAPDMTAAWEAAGSGVPQLNGYPIPNKYIDALRIIPMPDGRYRMELGVGTTTWPIYDANDQMVVFDLPKLMEAWE